MAVLHPLYFTAGRYTADLDRAQIASNYDPLSTKAREGGVLPPASSMRPYISSGRTITVDTGMCVIPDAATASTDSPGLYLAGVDTSVETVTLASTQSVPHYIYAQVDESQYYVTNKVLATNSVTLTYTATEQKFVVGQKLYVRGVDDTFDGVYPITGVGGSGTSWTASYARTATDVAPTTVMPIAIGTNTGDAAIKITSIAMGAPAASGSSGIFMADVTVTGTHAYAAGDTVIIRGAGPEYDGTFFISAISTTVSFTYRKEAYSQAATITANNFATVSVPFAIKSSTTAPSTNSLNAIVLAQAYVDGSGNAISATFADMRTFVSSNGGMHLWASAAVSGVTSSATPQPTSAPGRLTYDISAANNHMQVYDSKLNSWATLYKSGDWSHLIDATQADSKKAAAATHLHNAQYARVIATGSDTSSGTNVTLTTANQTLTSLSFTPTVDCSVLILANASVVLSGTTAGNYAIVSIQLGSGSVLNPTYCGNAAGKFSLTTFALVTLVAGTPYTIKVVAEKTASALTAVTDYQSIAYAPIKNTTTP